ncbi:hypothetical protein [uncultured Desulfosarcina sp.]|uniref:hypothetical protein n=1 Tax=uncultured Desulfosarcina sp. TaxID=218289 RepID=UPI0029C86CCE|nr:hypothetical protein [uncultured Desulfosarcina sp.]
MKKNDEMVMLARETAFDEFATKPSSLTIMPSIVRIFPKYSKHLPGEFMFLGTDSRKIGAHLSHHHPQFKIDEEALLIGAKMFVSGTLDFF